MKKDKQLTNSDLVARSNKDYIAQPMGEEIIIMDVDAGKYIAINKMAAEIWAMLDKPVIVNDIVDTLLNRYEVSREQCERETITCLMEMYASKILTIG